MVDGGGWHLRTAETRRNEENEMERPDQEQPDRRALIKKLGKAAALPMIVSTFLASDVTDAAAN